MGETSSFASFFIRVTEPFLPVDRAKFGVDELRKARLLVGLCSLLVLIAILGNITGFLLTTERPWFYPITSGVRMLIAGFLLYNLFSFRRTGELQRASLILFLSITCMLVMDAVTSGGTKTVGLFLLLALPLMSVFLLGLKWGWCTTLGILLFLPILHQPFVHTIAPPPIVVSEPTINIFFFCIMLFFFMGVSWLFESSRKASHDALEESHTENLHLAMSRDKAHHENQAKSEFLATMSHELRTPLNAIIGYTELLSEDAKDDGVPHYIDDLSRIKYAGHHLLALVNDILDLSKIEAGHIKLEYEAFNLPLFLEHLERNTETLVQKNDNVFSLTNEVDEEEWPSFQMDPRRLHQILLNLLGNAAKFTEKGEIELGIKVEIDKEEKAWLQFTVRDTGIGMSAKQLSRIFEKFTQADSSTTRKYGGTGLGLAITKELCGLMGGSIQAKSTPDEGSTFTITLPTLPPTNLLSLSDSNDSLEAQQATSSKARKDHQMLALVIDDEHVVIDLLSRLLRDEDYEVVTCSSSKDAYHLAKQIKPDLITLDVMMGEVDGWSLLSKFKSDPELEDIPVLMVTLLNEQEKGYALGASEYVTKPFSRDSLRKLLRKYQVRGKHGTLLLVEDQLDTRNIASRMLQKEGWKVTEAENGAVALSILADVRPDVILLDLMMPDVDGFQFLAELRRHEDEGLREIPVVIFTAKELTTQEKLLLQAQAQRIFAKGEARYDETVLSQLRRSLRLYLS